MDPLFMATRLFRRKRYEECVKACTEILDHNPYDQAAWFMKARALTEQTYVDEVDMEEEGIAEALLDETAIADVSRPGTSLKKPPGSSAGFGKSQGIRPLSQSGRPVSGFVRPGTQSGQARSMEQALGAPRTAFTARPVTSASGRYVRLGTASMLTEPGGPFIDVSKLDLNKYAQKPALSKALFEYLFHHEGNVRSALELAAASTEACGFKDWWWKVQLGKCYHRLGMYRDAEQQFKSALKHRDATVDVYLYLCKVYVKLDQPNTALRHYKEGLERFKDNPSILTRIARIHEGLDNEEETLQYYKQVLCVDNTSIEAIASIATHYFYNDLPEIALRYFRRLLQMGVHNAELFTNLGLCCYYAQLFDMALSCLQRALDLATEENVADVWYNIGNVAVGMGDRKLAYHSFKVALANNNDHAEAYNNLGVLEWRRERGEVALACFQSCAHLAPHFYESHFNIALASDKIGNLQDSYTSVQKSLEVFPRHEESKELLKSLRQHFAAL